MNPRKLVKESKEIRMSVIDKLRGMRPREAATVLEGFDKERLVHTVLDCLDYIDDLANEIIEFENEEELIPAEECDVCKDRREYYCGCDPEFENEEEVVTEQQNARFNQRTGDIISDAESTTCPACGKVNLALELQGTSSCKNCGYDLALGDIE